MDLSWEKRYKPKRKLYFLRADAATGYDDFRLEKGNDWFTRFGSLYHPLSSMGIYYLPEAMTQEGTSRMCCGQEIEFSDNDPLPKDCEVMVLPGFDMVEIKGFDAELMEQIPRLMSTAYSYAKLYIENEKIHLVSESALPYACFVEQNRTLTVEIPVWSIKTKTEEMLTVNAIPKRYLYELAYRDAATGYYNWNWISAKLEQLKYIGIEKFIFAKFDIKNFKLINNIFGVDAAREMFKFVVDAMSEQDWILYSAKCEQDNFAFIVKDLDEEELTEKLFRFFEDIGYLPSNKKYSIFYRCGMVAYTGSDDHDMSLEAMVTMAQIQGVKNNVTEVILYTDEMKQKYIMGQKYKVELPNAIENEDLVVYLQPKYNPANDKLTGAEALIRWFYQGDELLSPGKFVPQFEADGTIDIIDRFVLRQVCRKFVEWKSLDLPLYPISCNLSRHQLVRPDLIYILCDIVDEYGIDHELIDFEITESADFQDTAYLIEVLKEIKAKGFKISMDDFGTGYSSLSLLKDMPIDIMKIDKSFIDGIAVGEVNNKDMLMAKDVLTIANHLGIKSLAEGVETFEQKEYLRQWGCNYIQGYYYSKPIPIRDYEYLLRRAKLDM